MWNRRLTGRPCRKLIVFLLFVELYTVCASGQTDKPSDADIDRAIAECSVGTSRDVNVDAGLYRLKKRILSGKAAYSDSQIPRVLGSPVGDKSKIERFKTIQKCVIDKLHPEYETRSVPGAAPTIAPGPVELPGTPGLAPKKLPAPPNREGD